jgi:hypothetical protein
MKRGSSLVVNANGVFPSGDDEETSILNTGRDDIATIPSPHQGTDVGTSTTLLNEYQKLPEASTLQWTDDFFAHNKDIVAVFDLNYDAVWAFHTMQLCSTALTIISLFYGAMIFIWFGMTFIMSLCMFILYCLVSFCIAIQMSRYAKAQHVAVTLHGVRFVVDEHPTLFGIPWKVYGKTTTTVCFLLRLLFFFKVLLAYF